MNISLPALLIVLFSQAGYAADIVFLRGEPEKEAQLPAGSEIPESYQPKILLRGDISTSDLTAMKKVIAAARVSWPDLSNVEVSLDSLGGDVETAMAVGEQIRNNHLRTSVKSGATCASACVLVLASGVVRSIWSGSRIGLHRPYFLDSKAATSQGYKDFELRYNEALSKHRAYFEKMGITPELVDAMSRIPSNEVRLIDDIDPQLASRTNLNGNDATYLEWVRAKRTADIGESCIAREDKIWQCFYKTHSYEQCAASVPPSSCR